MVILDSVDKLKEWRSKLIGSLGFVPTMGFLHDGHMSLIQASVSENDKTLVSIFVNPSQFNNEDDLINYPRDMKRDLTMCSENGVDAVFTPSPDDMYRPGFDSWINVEQMSSRLEGAHRPGHFRGVATIVFLLFQLCKATRAYFGQKDAQQLLVIQRMVKDLHISTEITGMPIIREADGLAISSRNARLTSSERSAAPVLYQALCAAEKLYKQGEKNSGKIISEMKSIINDGGLFTVEYISVADAETLEEQSTVSPPTLVSLAAHIGKVRLIDNILLQQ